MATVTAAVGAIGGAANIASGIAKSKKAMAAIENFRWQDLQNPFDEVSVATQGTDRALEEIKRSEAAALDNLKAAGARGVIAGSGGVQQRTTEATGKVSAQLDQREQELASKKAQVELQNQAMKEKRQADELAGYGALLAQGQQQQMTGFGNMVSALGMVGQTEWGASMDTSITEGVKNLFTK